ncbi:hypothetical protein [Massilia consociata]|uniref:Uncharacterized protein n=1 Tax=Massilia consociata TaxID=760117 RepID=A0ABV6FAV5_9BURK
MRTKLLLAAAAFVTLGASATANAGPATDHRTAGTERVTVVGAQPKPAMMAPFMFDRVQGDYALDDGRTLTVSGKGSGATRTLYANLGDGPVELVHVGKNRFVAMNKDVRFAFEGDRKIPDSVRISTGAGRQIALAQR